MKCPVCGSEMRPGTIAGAGIRLHLKWLDDEHANDDGLFLPYKHLLCDGDGETTYYCSACGVIAMTVEEYEDPLRKAADKLKTMAGLAAAERERISEERREARRERQRDKRRKQDPWEDGSL